MNTSFLSPVAFAVWILLAAASPAPAKGMPPVDPFVSAVSPSAVEQEVRRMFEDYFKNSYTFVLLKQGVRWRIKHVHESSL
jgi:hypothetical protein